VTILRETQTWRRPRKHVAFELSPEEQANVKRALKAIRAQVGGWRPLAQRLRCSVEAVRKPAGNGIRSNSVPSPGLALRAAQVAGVPVEDILSGAWPRECSCPTCGR
jgi:hypothetical protein